MKHTELPWATGSIGELQEDDELEFCRLYGPGENVTICDAWSEANAEFIVKACNAHYGLIEALKMIASIGRKHFDSYESSVFAKIAREAIEKVSK